MADISENANDGGGAQDTFLELNRKWIETAEKKYRDFKEVYKG